MRRRNIVSFAATVLLIVAVTLGFDTRCQAQSIGVSVGALGGNITGPQARLQPGEVAGALPQANWNDLSVLGIGSPGAPPTPPAGSLKDSAGNWVPNFTVAFDDGFGDIFLYQSTYNYGLDGEHDADLKLMGGFLKGADGATPSGALGIEMTLTDVPYAEYDLYIYVDGYGSGVTIWDLSNGQTHYSVDASPINFLVSNFVYSEYGSTSEDDAFAEFANPSSTHNYIKIAGLTDSDLTLMATRIPSSDNTGEEAITAIQIVNASIQEPILGDYDRNNVVNVEDYNLWKETFGSQISAGAAADGNSDGSVNAADYVVWRKVFDSLPGAGSANPVPEPSGLGMFVAGLIGCCSLFKSRRCGAR